MRIEGQFVFDGISPEAVWNFLTDANRIAECLPGCERLTQTGKDTYEMQMKIGLGAISGAFVGGIRLHDMQPPSDYQMTVNGSGAPGFVNGEGKIQMTSNGNGTALHYSGDVNAGGPIASLGQRMIGGAARMVIDQFFKCAAGKLNTIAN
jgi:hypothetical protein